MEEQEIWQSRATEAMGGNRANARIARHTRDQTHLTMTHRMPFTPIVPNDNNPLIYGDENEQIKLHSV